MACGQGRLTGRAVPAPTAAVVAEGGGGASPAHSQPVRRPGVSHAMIAVVAGLTQVCARRHPWLARYPVELARLLRHDHVTLHAEYQRGDWVVSFSGCVMAFGWPECNRLIEAHYGLSQAQLEAASTSHLR